jgi:hypothetical protein
LSGWTTTTTPPGATHWSPHDGRGPGSVRLQCNGRVDLGLAPHRVETFKVSNDPKFDDKLIDVVGLYLNPPEK